MRRVPVCACSVPKRRLRQGRGLSALRTAPGDWLMRGEGLVSTW